LATDQFTAGEFHPRHRQHEPLRQREMIARLFEANDFQQLTCDRIGINIREADRHRGRIRDGGWPPGHPRDQIAQHRPGVPVPRAVRDGLPAEIMDGIEDERAIEPQRRGIQFGRHGELHRKDQFLPDEDREHSDLAQHQRARLGRRMSGRGPWSMSAVRCPLANLSPNRSIFVRG